MTLQFLGKCSALTALLLVMPSSLLRAQTYNFAGATLTPSAVPANITAGNFGPGSGLTGGAPATFFGTSINGVPSDGILIRSDGTAATLGTALTGNDYIGFTVTPSAGYKLNMQNMTFDLTSSDNNGAADFVGNVVVRTSLDSFATTIDSYVAFNAGTGTPDPAEWFSQFLDLSGPEFQGITAPVEFRFYLFDNTTFQSDVFRFDNFVLNASAVQATAVPEPASWSVHLLVALCAALIAWRSQARKRAAPR